jgi:hypothetical protein
MSGKYRKYPGIFRKNPRIPRENPGVAWENPGLEAYQEWLAEENPGVA